MDRRDRIAAAALAHAGCSEVHNVDLYNEIVVRPVDRTPTVLPYYDRNPRLSTCSLTAIGALRLAGCEEPECLSTYFPASGGMRDAFSDLQALARRFGAWTGSSPPVAPMKKGDVWVIVDAQGSDGHMGTCTDDAVVAPDGSWSVPTVEGGQVPVNDSGALVAGSSAIAAFSGIHARHFVRDGARMRLGARYLLGYASAALLPIPDDLSPDPGDPPAAAAKLAA